MHPSAVLYTGLVCMAFPGFAMMVYIACVLFIFPSTLMITSN